MRGDPLENTFVGDPMDNFFVGNPMDNAFMRRSYLINQLVLVLCRLTDTREMNSIGSGPM